MTWTATPFRGALANVLLREIIAGPGNHLTALSWDSPDPKLSVYQSADGGMSWITTNNLLARYNEAATLVQGDTSDARRAEEIVAEAAEKLGGCDIFVQSVIPTLDQIYEHTLATEVTLAKWQIAFDTQSRAFFVGAPAAAKHMSPGGRILALSYKPGGVTGGWQPWVGMGSAKAAVESMCRYFAVALARHGITVNAVSPGPSDETTVIGQTPKEVRDAPNEWVSAGWTPMRSRVTPSDVANVCALLCSEEASFLTGQTIVVDGGSSLMNPDFPLALQVPK